MSWIKSLAGNFAAFLLQDILDEIQIVWYFAETLWFLEPKRRCKGQRIWCLVLPVCPTFWDVSIISIQTWSKSTVLVLGFVPKCKLYSQYFLQDVKARIRADEALRQPYLPGSSESEKEWTPKTGWSLDPTDSTAFPWIPFQIQHSPLLLVPSHTETAA